MTSENPTIELKGVNVLEYSERPYTNKKGESVVFKEAIVSFQGKVLKLSVDKDTVLTNVKGKVCDVTVALETWGDSLSPTLRVVEAKVPK